VKRGKEINRDKKQ